MKQKFVSYTPRRASSNCHILIWIAIATRRANMGCRNTTWSPLSACLTSKLSIIDSVTLTLSSSLSLALSLSLSHSPQFSHTLLPLSDTHTLSLSLSLTLYCWQVLLPFTDSDSLSPSLSLALDQDTVGRCDSVSVEGVTTWMYNGVIEVMRKGETDIGTSCVCETAAHS